MVDVIAATAIHGSVTASSKEAVITGTAIKRILATGHIVGQRIEIITMEYIVAIATVYRVIT